MEIYVIVFIRKKKPAVNGLQAFLLAEKGGPFPINTAAP